MHWICPLYKLSTCWVFVEVLLSAVFKWPQQWLNMLSSPKISQGLMLNHGWEWRIRWALRVRGLNMLSVAVQMHSILLSHAWMTAKQRKCVSCVVWPVSNFSQQVSTPPDISPRCSWMRSTCWAEHVESLCRGQIQWICTMLKDIDHFQLFRGTQPLYPFSNRILRCHVIDHGYLQCIILKN